METMCDFPINIANKKFGIIPGEFKRILVPCNKCVKCHKRKSAHWFIRLKYELKEATSAYFVTLTYQHAPRSYNGLLTAQKEDLQKYFKRLRKSENGNTRIKYYAASEYGEMYQRPHYHAIIFNVQEERNIQRAWSINQLPIGNIQVDELNDARINYVTGYIGKKIGIPHDDYDDRLSEFSLMSKNMGLYFINNVAQINQANELGYTVINGIKYNLPRYYKNKIFDEATLKKISKNNYAYYIKNQDKLAKNFPSILHWEKNSREIAQRNNKSKQIIISPNF